MLQPHLKINSRKGWKKLFLGLKNGDKDLSMSVILRSLSSLSLHTLFQSLSVSRTHSHSHSHSHTISLSTPHSPHSISTRDGSWTRTDITIHRILSPACLPVPPPGHYIKFKVDVSFKIKSAGWCPHFFLTIERETRLELATLTLARWCSTNWATPA